MLSRKAYLNYIGTYLTYPVDLLPASNMLSSSLKMGSGKHII